MSKELDKLIEQVLAEKITNNLVSPPAAVYSGYANDKAPDDKEDIENWAKLGVPAGAQSRKDASKQFAKLAAKTSPNEELEATDLEAAIKTMVDKIASGQKFTPVQKLANKAIERLRSKKADEKIRKAVDQMIRDYVLGSVEQGDPNAAGKVKELTSAITSYIDKLADQRVSAFSGQQMPLRSLETAEQEFKKGTMPKASPYLVDLFSGIDGDSIQAKLKSISDFSQAAQNDTLDKWAEGKNEFAPYIYGKVLSFLAEEIKKTGASEAGFQFERWIALLLNLPVAGAEQGAADNLGKIAKGIVYTSAKLYADIYGENSPSQAKDKLYTTTNKGKNNIYYFIAHKITGKSAGGQKGKVQGFHFIDEIDLYLVEVSENMSNAQPNPAMDAFMEKEKSPRRGPYGTLEGRFVYDGATKRSKPWELKTKTQKGKASENQAVLTPQDVSLAGNVKEYKLATIYLPQGEITDNQLQTTAELLAQRVNQLDPKKNPVTAAIMDAARALKKMEADTDSYAGVTKKGKESATAYIKEIGDEYAGLRSTYNTIFNYGEKTKGQQYIKESELSLDQLIEAIIKEKLLK